MIRWVILFLVFIFLTLLTQIGGVVILLTVLLVRIIGWQKRWKKLLFSITLYLITTFGIVPNVAPLDANFPFINGFPLLPHLSHNDGRKLDLALIYENKNGIIIPAKKSRTGYGVYVDSNDGEVDQTQKCKQAGYYQYDYSKYFSFGAVNKHLDFSEKGTKILVEALLENRETDSRIRFHGCRAVRHDDHIHLQIHP